MQSGFRQVHPVISFMYFMGIIFLSMLFKKSIYLLTLLVLTVLFLVLLDQLHSLLPNLKFYLFMAFLILLLNPFFATQGSTVLFYIKNRSITLEGVLAGLVFSLSLLNILFAFTAYNLIISSQKFLYLFGNVVPKLSFILMIMMRFIPLFRRRMTDILDIHKTLHTSYEKKSYKELLTDSMTTFNTLVSWTLEESLENASAMRARGYGICKRTSTIHYAFTLRDLLLALVLLLTFIFTLIGYFYDKGKNSFSFIHYSIFVLFSATPFLIEMREYLRWHFMKYNT